MKNWLVFVAMLGLLFVAVPAFSATVEPGVDVSASIVPSTGSGQTTTTRTMTVVNSNATSTKTYELGPTYVATSTLISAPFTASVSGARNGRVFRMPIPADCSFVSGSLKINGVAQPDPTIGTNLYYTLTLDLPASSTTTVVDKATINPPG